MRIAILTPSTDPQGGVAHALSLGEALCGLGHEAVVHAPDPDGRGFFRPARCPVVSVAARASTAAVEETVRARIGDYLAHFSTPAACDFDVFHAHCGIGGNALATLTRRRLVPGFARTVHGLDAPAGWRLADPQLARLHERAILDAGRLLCLDRAGAAALAAAYGARADVVGLGVDEAIYTPAPDPGDGDLARRLGLGAGPVFLCVGGVRARENTVAVVAALAALRRALPRAQLVLAGGASKGIAPGGDPSPDAGYEARCGAALEQAGIEVGPGKPVVRTGPVRQAEWPALYRLADALVDASRDGHGHGVLEAMASGTPALVARRPPFTEMFRPAEALLVDPDDPAAIAAAMRAALEPGRRAALAAAGCAAARAHGWAACASRHMPAYTALLREPVPGPAATGSGAWNTTRSPGRA